MTFAYDTEIVSRSNHYIKEFAEHFVQSIIDEALKQSSKTTWLIHCSESCHKLNPLYVKKLNSYICWTPERNQALHRHVNETAKSKGADCTSAFFCKPVEEKHRGSAIHEHDLYALPVDSIGKAKSSEIHRKTIAREGKCLKPKAIHALNVFRSSHQKTFSDFKLFLINLYSSEDIAPKKIGSENSAFTKYCCQNASNAQRGGNGETAVDDRAKRKSKNQGKTLRVVHMKTETDLKNIRKCNRVKRYTFLNIKHSFCNVFKSHKTLNRDESINESCFISFKDRSLPPLPSQSACSCPCEKSENLLPESRERNSSAGIAEYEEERVYNYEDEYMEQDCMVHRNKAFDFAANIEKVKDYGWYWGPMSSEAAEKLLENERDGSFIVRDSSDDRYIFSLTFKLNACIRHVRIEHGQGNFSFGNYTKFKSHTIVDFIENAVQHSRSGRYLFFLHRRPILGPMRVQLLYPVSRFKHVQSLQHMCRFVILKTVRRDLITSLPLPKAMIEYLSSKDYYTEQKL